MPKKQSRQISKSQNTAEKTATTSFATTGQVFSNDFNPDYTHVFKDLKRIAVMATSFVLLLVALSFFIK
jgi:hypothetical protein